MDIVEKIRQASKAIERALKATGQWYQRRPRYQKKLIVAGGVAVLAGSGARVAAGPIATTLGGLGVLGSTATTGTAITTLSGVAATNASLAACGGGALAAGGGGMAAGAVTLGGVTGSVGALAGAAVV